MGKQGRKRRERREGKKRDPAGAEGTLGYWAIAFLDLMGYGALLDAFDVYPLPEDQAAQDELSKLAMRPHHFRRRLVDGIRKFLEGNAEAHPGLAGLPTEYQRLATRWRAVRINTAVLGDAVTMEVALNGDEKHFPSRALDTMLTAACSASLLQLAMGEDDPGDTLPLRGGIDIGTGVVVDGQLYSAALKKAVRLEDEAEFPRVLVGERLREYVDGMADSEGEDLTAQYVRKLMSAARGFFFQDPDDGKWCLDFLGRQFRHRMSQGPSTPALVRSAQIFVSKALVLHKDNPHLLKKYEWLAKYMTSRLSLWGLS